MRPGSSGSIALAGAAVLALSSAPALANWTATGRFVYVDREYDQTGFTGVETQRSVRFADVHVLDSKNKVLASGATDANGNFSIFVVDSQTRTVYARVTSRSLNTPTLFVDIQSNNSGNIKYYAVKGANVTGHNPNTNLNFGTIVALKGQGGEAFNLFDQVVMGADYIALLRGSRPPAADDLSVVWAIDRGVTDSSYSRPARRIELRDTAGYDDTVVLHEMGHFLITEYSATDSPDFPHTFSNCNEDIRQAHEEGWATYFGNASLRFHGLPHCNIYTRTNGGPGPGNLVRYADLETDTQYLCVGDTSEVSVFTILWDITDSTLTTDTTPGAEDAHDLLSLPDSETWEVQRDYVTTAVSKSFEDFWDGWFLPPISNGFLAQMLAVCQYVGVDFSEDSAEPNNTSATAAPIQVAGANVIATIFFDTDGDGAGEPDVDYFAFSATSGQTYRAKTGAQISDANTFLELLDSNGSTVLASNNDVAPGNEDSQIDWTAPRSDTFYLRVTHWPDWGVYGTYLIRIDPL